MVAIAVSGVSNGLGQTIARALLSNPSHSVTILSRSAQPQLTALGAIVLIADYTSIPRLTAALQGIHTLITTIYSPVDSSPTENLITAAAAAGVVRFAPSEFAISGTATPSLGAYAFKLRAWDQAKSAGLQVTAFRIGIFMDYFASGSPKGYDGALQIFPFLLNIPARRAEIPGTGDERVTFTTVEDVGKFVNAAVGLDRWEEESGMSGETTTYNEVVRLVEETIGEKIHVTYIGPAELESRAKAAGSVGGRFLTEVMLAITEGKGEVEPVLNRKANVSTTSVSKFLNKWWGKE